VLTDAVREAQEWVTKMASGATLIFPDSTTRKLLIRNFIP
jgi:hypothetical protein